MSIRASICQILGEDSKNHSIEREASKRIRVLPRETDKSSNDYQTRFCLSTSVDENL